MRGRAGRRLPLRTAAAIQRAVLDELERDLGIDAGSIRVSARDAAEQAAWSAPGITEVDNLLEVENELSVSAAES